MSSPTTNRRMATLVGVAAPIILVTNVAYAAWTASGTGTGEATSLTAQDLTVTAAVVDDLYPLSSSDVHMTITNANPYNVDLDSVTFGDTMASNVDCNASSVSFDDVADLGLVVGANSSLNVKLVDAAHMSNDANDDCQTNSFTVEVTVTGASTGDPASTDQF